MCPLIDLCGGFKAHSEVTKEVLPSTVQLRMFTRYYNTKKCSSGDSYSPNQCLTISKYISQKHYSKILLAHCLLSYPIRLMVIQYGLGLCAKVTQLMTVMS